MKLAQRVSKLLYMGCLYQSVVVIGQNTPAIQRSTKLMTNFQEIRFAFS
jgi:hypothetical protein